MIIGVDAGALSITDDRLKAGVYRYTLRTLQELARIDTENTYRLYTFLPIEKNVLQKLGRNMQNIVLRPAKGWFTLRLPFELKIHPVDVFLGLSQAIPVNRAHNVGVIYDLGFLYTPEAYSGAAKKLKAQTNALVARSEHIITISEASKLDILREYAIDSEKITVSYAGIDEGFTAKGTKFMSENPYVLFVGSLNKAKDIPRAIRAFSLFLKKVQRPYDFILIGGDYWPDPNIDATITECDVFERVKKLHFVSHDQLPAYYRGAKAFFTTPLREGFCLPIVEAMACGTPVVSVARGSVAEIVGSGGIIAKSVRETDIADALTTLFLRPEVLEVYKQRALRRARQFSWASFSTTMFSVLQQYEHKTQ